MNDPLKHIDLFEAYLDGDLKPSDKVSFEQRLQDDPVFAEEFQTYEIGLQIIQNAGFKNEVTAFMEKKRQKKQPVIKRFWAGGIAASLTLIAIFTWLTLKQSPFEQYYEPYPNVLSTRGGSAMSKGFEAYTKGDYEAAVLSFEQVQNASDTLSFYKGISYIETDELKRAITSFETIPPNSIFYPQSNWYRGLIYLKTDDPENARKSFLKLNSGDFKYQEAQKLLVKD